MSNTPYKNLAEILKSQREKRGLDLIRVYKETKIQQKFLEALEKGEYALLPAPPYPKNFVKIYAAFLGLDVEKVLRVFEREYSAYKDIRQIKDTSGPTKGVHFTQLFDTPRFFKKVLVGLMICVCFGYLLLKARQMVTPPYLEIISPNDNITVSSPLIKIEGRTAPAATLFINGQPVLVSENGSFSETVNLRSGLNIVKIEAVKKYSRPQIIKRNIMVESN